MLTFTLNNDLSSFEECKNFYNDFSEFIKQDDKENLYIIDLAEVKYISSTGIGRIIAIDKTLKNCPKNIQLINIKPAILMVLREVGLKELLSNFKIEGLSL